jgi:hypothetical protein
MRPESASRPRRSSCQTAPPSAVARPTEYHLGVLAEPDLLYLVVVTLRASAASGADRALPRVDRALQRLVPLQTQRRGAALSCWLLCTAPAASAAAWKVVEQARELPGAVVVQVEAGLPGEKPELVLTREPPRASKAAQERER